MSDLAASVAGSFVRLFDAVLCDVGVGRVLGMYAIASTVGCVEGGAVSS